MNSAKHITILSGGGSPHSEAYREVYKLIEDEAAARGFTAQLIDYVGVGPSPDFGSGLSLPEAVEKAQKDIKGRPAPLRSTLLCRSFGCDVGMYLFAHYPEEVAAFNRIILWGPSGLHMYWDLVARAPDSLNRLNESVKDTKGLLLHTDFWKTFRPIEESMKAITKLNVEIGYGTNDDYCDAAFAHYLAEICWKHTPCPVRVVEIKGAEHEIRSAPKLSSRVSPQVHERIKTEYFKLIFGVERELNITNWKP